MSPSYSPKCHRRDDRSYVVFALVPSVPPHDPSHLNYVRVIAALGGAL